MNSLILLLFAIGGGEVPAERTELYDLEPYPPCYRIEVPDSALDGLKDKAADGDSRAARLVALHFKNKQGAKEEYVKWIMKSAGLGNAISQLDLAGIYGSEEPELKEFWLLRSSQKGLKMSFYALAGFYSKEDRDMELHKYWIRRAALAGSLNDLQKLVSDKENLLKLNEEELGVWKSAIRALKRGSSGIKLGKDIDGMRARQARALVEEFKVNRKRLEEVLADDSEINTRYFYYQDACQ